ncbi:GRAM-domain-containing protein [Panus rudis PR-1116 ss-1]|nr:GRAM-domain-containing protein [Panus rudis PR-1116 ss-1]
MPSGRSKRSNSVVSGTLPSAGTTASSHRRRPSADYPRTPPSRGSRSRQTSISYATSDLSDRASFYSGDEGNELLSGSEEDEEDLDDLDLDTDIPVTGFAVASNRRNQEFHDMFANIPEGDYLIEDYGCALQREILVQGRLYISENHVCFHANIFGWVTDLVIPMHEVIQLEKRMTAFVIPNAIQISTRNTKYTFTSFLSRDTTYDVLYNVWRLARPDSETASALGSASQLTAGDTISVGMTGESVPVASVKAAAGKKGNKVTQCACGKAGEHFNEVAMDVVLPGTPEKIYNLMFTSGFIKEFMRNDQKLFDIQISDWMPIQDNPALLARNMSYIKPLSGSIGPKQTKCEIHDELLHFDFEDYVVMMTTTRTPDVPSGGVFAVKTKTCITWASSISTRVLVTTQVEWSGRSFIKGIIEKSCIDGQKTYHNDLEKAMREYIHQHQSEFIPEGVDVTEVAEAEPLTEAPKTPTLGERTPPQDEQARKAREQERNLRGLQWAYDTFEGAFKVAKQSTEGALELIRDAWDQSSTNTILYFVIVILVISNIWTLTKMGKREEIGRRKEMKKTEEREQWVQGVVTALWEELNHGKPSVAGSTILREGIGAPDWRSEVHELTAALDTIEDRVKRLRDALHNVD